MRFAEKTITLKDGRTCILKPATPDLAEELIRFLKQIAAETPFLTRYPDEVDKKAEEEAEFLNRTLENPAAAMLAATVDGKLAGNCSFFGMGARRKNRHRCSMGIALYEKYWGLGIGTAMIAYLSELAKQAGLEQMELIVVADNERAKALYRKSGFIEYGRLPHGMLFDDGSYHDEILMYKEL